MYTYVSQLLYGRGMPRPISISIYFGVKEFTSALGRGMPRPYTNSAPLVSLFISAQRKLLLLCVAACRDRTTIAHSRVPLIYPPQVQPYSRESQRIRNDTPGAYTAPYISFQSKVRTQAFEVRICKVRE